MSRSESFDKVGGRSEEVGVFQSVKSRELRVKRCKVKRMHKEIFAGAVRGHQANELRDTNMSRLRRVNRMCSSTLSVNCEYFTKDTQR